MGKNNEVGYGVVADNKIELKTIFDKEDRAAKKKANMTEKDQDRI
jgi:hypothetical protein